MAGRALFWADTASVKVLEWEVLSIHRNRKRLGGEGRAAIGYREVYTEVERGAEVVSCSTLQAMRRVHIFILRIRRNHKRFDNEETWTDLHCERSFLQLFARMDF